MKEFFRSYERLERGYMFEADTSLCQQHIKMIEEHEEVGAEVIPYPETDTLFFKGRLEDYVNEIQDLMLACNNQLLRIEREYGKDALKRMMDNWDFKINTYRDKKYSIGGR